MKLYRGTQREISKGKKKTPSYTPSLPVAVIYSAHPGYGGNPYFLPSSTVHVAELQDNARIIELCSHNNHCSFQRVLDVLQYGEPNGLTWDEALKILWYMHFRLTGRNAGGDFLYKVFNEEGDTENEFDLPLSLSDPITLIYEFREEFEYDDKIGSRLLADAFIFADAPRFGIVGSRLGFDAVSYRDIFSAEKAAKVLLSCEDIYDLEGVDEEEDLEEEYVPAHKTVRPLHDGAIQIVESIPTAQLLPTVACVVPGDDPRLKQMKSRLLR